MKFSKWLNEVKGWDFPWPVRPGVGEDPTEKDDPPELTPSGDYVLYHGTATSLARKILDERRILHDDWKMVGVTTTPSEAWSYGQMKAIDLRKENPEEEPVVLRVVIDRGWLEGQEIQREVGGTGINTWLINVVEVPSSAIKDLRVHKRLS
jgi:hypothetical protein